MNYTDVQQAIKHLEPFEHTSCSAQAHDLNSAPHIYTGQLSTEDRATLVSDALAGDLDRDRDRNFYVVFSYGTPIAWAWTTRSGTMMRRIPDVRYSTTTSKQQTYVRASLPGKDAS